MQIYIDSKDLFKLERDFRNIDKHFPKLGEKIRRDLANKTKRYAKSNIQPIWMKSKHSYDLKNNIIYRKEGNNKTTVIARTPYAGYVEMGTKPHKIIGHPYLSFYWEKLGKNVRLREVNHPGAQGYPSQHFMERAYNQIVVESDSIIQKEVDKFFNQRGF